MEREFIAHYIKGRFQGMRTSQSRCNQKVLRKLVEVLDRSVHQKALEGAHGGLEALEDIVRSTQRLQDSATKSSRACQIRGSGTAHRRRKF